MMKKTGRIIIPDGVDVWPHELESAKALIKFISRHGQVIDIF